MTNTHKRLLSATFLIGLVALLFSLGPSALVWLVLVSAVLANHEVLWNFIQLRVPLVFYGLFQLLFVSVLGCFQGEMAIWASCLNGLLLCYLACVPLGSRALACGKELKWVGALVLSGVILLQALALKELMYLTEALKAACLVILITTAMDSGAWFVGRNWGRRKLWPSVSPNKTVEGALGGVALTMVVVPLLGGYLLPHIAPIDYLWGVPLLAVISQLGDLFQSKLKREFNLKDSSALIPGHGGVYDRLDSLLFVTPFFIIWFRQVGGS